MAGTKVKRQEITFRQTSSTGTVEGRRTVRQKNKVVWKRKQTSKTADESHGKTNGNAKEQTYSLTKEQVEEKGREAERPAVT